MDVLSLPVEIQEYILSFLDAGSLVRCSKVCKLWRKLTRGCWQQCCLREIPTDVLAEILGSCQPVRRMIQYCETSLTWESLFLKWSHYTAVCKMPHQTFSLPFRNTGSNYRCIIHLSGDFLILAPTVENVRVYKVHIYESGKCVGIIAKHMQPIQDIVLLDIQKKGPYKIKGSRKLAEHDTVISLSLDHFVQINELNCHCRKPRKLWEMYLPSDCLDASIKVFGNTFVIACQDRTISIWKVYAKAGKMSNITVEGVGNIVCPIPITHVNVWKDQVVCLWWNLPGVHLMTWDLMKQVWTENVYIENILCGPNISAFRSLIFGVGAQLTILKNGQFFQKYDLWESLGQSKVPVGKVTAVCLKRNLLVLGTRAGEVYIFLINQDSQLRNLKYASPVNAIKITPSSTYAQQEIRNLDVSFDGSGLQIAAQTTEAVHVIRWFPSEQELRQQPVVELPSMCGNSWCNEDDYAELSDPEYWFYDSD